MADAILSGIYAITNTVNGKQYIGSAVNLSKRWTRHKYRLNVGKHHNLILSRAWIKYGKDAFSFSVIEYVSDLSLLSAREQHWIDSMFPEYNLSPTAGSVLGYRHSQESLDKMSMSQKGVKRKPLSAEHKEAIRLAGVGRLPTEETRMKIAAAHRGKPKSEEHKANLAAANLGKKMSDEVRKKMSEAQTGLKRPRTAEHMAKIIESRRRNKLAKQQATQ